MVYKRKLIILLSLAGILLLANILVTLINSGWASSRSSSFSWIDPRSEGRIDGIEIRGTAEEVSLIRRNNLWYVHNEGRDYPAKQERVEDFLALFTRKQEWPLRSSSSSSHARLGVGEAEAERITLKAGAGLPLLDLLSGVTDATGREIYLRKAGEDAVRSGEDGFSSYLSGSLTSWYNLRLFPAAEKGGPRPSDVQRVTLEFPPAARDEAEGSTVQAASLALTFTRDGNNWNMSGADTAVERTKVESWLQGILNTEGENFAPAQAGPYDSGRVSLELGNGSVLVIGFSPQDASGKRNVTVSGSNELYILADWAVSRIFREAAYFETQ
ncbi:MAG: DUF4340 domain-containing protein [Treponema sp.]|jgi:hypothetical protein|nr:DUF4340 domain-containing protein [Treponema sp.]